MVWNGFFFKTNFNFSNKKSNLKFPRDQRLYPQPVFSELQQIEKDFFIAIIRCRRNIPLSDRRGKKKGSFRRLRCTICDHSNTLVNRSVKYHRLADTRLGRGKLCLARPRFRSSPIFPKFSPIKLETYRRRTRS